MTKYIFVLGGVYSGCGKGVACASLAFLMKQRGHKVQCLKFDPYLNTDASVINPNDHGENYVTDCGFECDLDVGHYYRIAGVDVSRNSIYTSGRLLKELIDTHEEGKYLGQTLQVIPHWTNLIQEKVREVGAGVDLLVIEIGGTVGDLESGAYYETIRQMKQENPNDVLVMMVAPIIWVPTIQEHKTKPLQNSVRELQSHGVQPEILLCRVYHEDVPEKSLEKIAKLTNISRDCIFVGPDVRTIYEVPIKFYQDHLDDLIADKFHLKRNSCRIHKHRDLVERYLSEDLPEVTIGICGKYQNCHEAYLSLTEALDHAGVEHNVRVKIKWISAEDLEQARNLQKFFEDVDGVIVPGGFDSRGIEGKIAAIKYVRENKIPFLGICLGLQCAAIEVARNIGGLSANSSEFDKKTKNPIVDWVPGQEELKKKTGTMRLGAYDCELTKDSKAMGLYRKKVISERHRHRYEINPEYVEMLEECGFKVSGRNPQSGLVEIMELEWDHPYFIGTQAHPEFKSRLGNPAPLFSGLIGAASERTRISGV